MTKYMTVSSGVTSSGLTVSSGEFVRVLSGGTALGIVDHGGSAFVESGGKWYPPIPLTLAPNILGHVTVSLGGYIGYNVIGDGGHVDGAGDTTTVQAGGLLVGTDSAGHVASGGLFVVPNGGMAFETTVSYGGRLVLLSGGRSLNIPDLSGVLVVSSGGVAGGYGDEYGTSNGTNVHSGGNLVVSSGGVAHISIISNGGREDVKSGGIEAKYVLYGDERATVLSGGLLVVSGGGEAVRVSVSSGGAIYASSGGVLTSAAIGITGKPDTGHANLFVLSGGIVSAAVIGSAGRAFVREGGTVTGGLEVSGGIAVISGIMGAGQGANFAGSGGTLALYNLPDFAAPIKGFGVGDTIDLGLLAYGSTTSFRYVEAPNNLSGTLTVSDGGQSAHLKILGAYTSGSFTLSTDGAAGTLVKFT